MEEISFSIRVQRWIKIAAALAVGFWGAIGAIGNLLDWPGTYGSVQAVTSMALFDGGVQDWRATTSPLVVGTGAAFVPVFKALCAVLAFAGAAAMWRERSAGEEAFSTAKGLAIAGCAVAAFGLFFGWIVIGESWFEMWRDGGPNGLEAAGNAAFRYGAFIGVLGIAITQPER